MFSMSHHDATDRVIGIRGKGERAVAYYVMSLHPGMKFHPGDEIVIDVIIDLSDDGMEFNSLKDSYDALLALNSSMRGAVEQIFGRLVAASVAAGKEIQTKVAA